MAEQTDTLHRLRIKIGNAEFDAAGSEESVKAQYSAFLEALKAAPPSTGTHTPPPFAPSPGGAQPTPDQPNVLIDANAVRAFTVRGESVSLNALPRTENPAADAILLLLWGYEHFKQQTSVPSTTLADSARSSGLDLDRVDRSLAPQNRYFMRAGSRKGTRYSLNNPGRTHAAALLQALYQ